jgi:hypothetical protein
VPVIIGEWYYSALNNLKEQLALFIKFSGIFPDIRLAGEKFKKPGKSPRIMHPSAVKN